MDGNREKNINKKVRIEKRGRPGFVFYFQGLTPPICDHTEKEKLSERALSLGLLAKDAEKEVIIAALKNNNNNRVKTAAQLKISTTTLWRKMKILNIGVTYQYDTIS